MQHATRVAEIKIFTPEDYTPLPGFWLQRIYVTEIRNERVCFRQFAKQIKEVVKAARKSCIPIAKRIHRYKPIVQVFVMKNREEKV